jgi:predicted SAM-dependent methyltransferase
MMKLHIGGIEPKDGWKIMNIQPREGVDCLGDISDLSQFATDSVAEVYASHVLEHLPQSKVLATLQGLHRVLVPGGLLRLSVPDLDILCHTFISPQATLPMKWHVMRMMFGGQVDAHDFHYIGWNRDLLFDFLGQAGFKAAQRVEAHGIFKDTSDFKPYGVPISLNVVATK